MRTWLRRLKQQLPVLSLGVSEADPVRTIASKMADRRRALGSAVPGEEENILGLLMGDLAQIEAMDRETLIAKLEKVVAFLKSQDGDADGGDPERAAASVQVRTARERHTDVLAHILNPRAYLADDGESVGRAPLEARRAAEEVGFSVRRFSQRCLGGLDIADCHWGDHDERKRVRAAVDANKFDQVFADAARRSVLADYNGDPRWMVWRNLVRIVPIKDFRPHRAIKVGWYGFLPTVGERDPYPVLTTPTDSEEVLSLSKKGGVESISAENIANDDVTLWQNIVQRLGRSARETISEAVFSHLREATRPTLSDGKKLWDATRTDANGGTAVLSADAAGKAAFMSAVTAMAQLTGGSGQKKGVFPSFIIIPFAKTEAWAFIANALTAGNTGTDVPQALRDVLGFAIPKAIIDIGTANATDWMLMARPADAEVLRMGFHNGQEEPEVIVAGHATGGAMFSKDVLEMKIKHVYAVAPVDYSGVYGNDAAS